MRRSSRHAATLVLLVSVTLAAAGRANASTPSGFVVFPSPAVPNAELSGVSASGPSDAWAVGTVTVGSSTKGLIEHWNGTAWSRVTPAVLNGVSLNAVDAVSHNLAWAAGDDAGENGLILRWNGTSWTKLNAHAPGQYLDGVAGAGTDAWAVGTNGGAWWSESWNGTTWTHDTVVNQSADYFAGVSSVVAVSASNVWEAASQTFDGGGLDTNASMVHWNGTHWTTTMVGGTNGSPAGITAAGPSSLWAAGTWQKEGEYYPRGAIQPAIWHSTGGAWTFTKPFAPYTTDHYLTAVAAPTSSDVWAVGFRYSTGPSTRTLIVHWNGSAWSDLGGPNVGTGDNELDGITAVPGSNTQAWAVGFDGTSSLILHHP